MVKQQLQPFEKSLSSNQILINQSNKVLSISSVQSDVSLPATFPTTGNQATGDIDKKVSAFKESLKKTATDDTRYQLTDYFNKTKEIYNSVVKGLVSDSGDSISNISTGFNYNYKTYTYEYQQGIYNKFDDSKKIWLKLAATFYQGKMAIAISDAGKTEVFSSPMKSINWEAVRTFIKSYFVNKLDNLK